ncbi:protein draper-like isoform X3 [Saccostrea cucullata]|uniref:protein draper-like isoform X3 n=1 Tax=Saccostrea cuccullata TaxID=36930 RepID=UPI002ED272FA
MVLISFRIYFLAFVIGYTLAYVNVALNKPTWQSNPYRRENIFDSSNAVDGRTSDLSGRGGQCTKSASKHNTTTWWVNLTSIYSIHDIWIYYRTNNDEWSCRIGYYGPNCSLPCPDKCHHCHIEIGICHLCESGYQGLQCEFDCRNEYYGSNCSLPCPENCRYCHKETGVWEWCEPGYKGYQCEIVSTEEDKVWQLRFYSTLGAVIVAVTLNAFFITIIICLKLKRNEPKVQQTKTESCFPEANHIYDNPDGNIPGEYQQLGKLGESSQYDALKQIDGEQNSENVKIK